MTPLLSIIIPSRNRPEILQGAIENILQLDHEDIEVLVLENSDSANRIGEHRYNDVRLVVHTSQELLSMPDNWERGIKPARGEFITYISDKDRFLPGAISSALSILKNPDSDVYNYRKAAFFPEKRIVTGMKTTSAVQNVSSDGPLRTWFHYSKHLHNGPMIYNSFVKTALVRRIQSLHNRFFFGNSPDVGSGVSIACHTTRYNILDAVYCVGIFGSWSNGLTMIEKGPTGESSKEFWKEFKSNPLNDIGLLPTVSTAVAEVLLKCKTKFPQALSAYQLHVPGLVYSVISEILERTTPKEDKDRDLRLFAEQAMRFDKKGYLIGRLQHALRETPNQTIRNLFRKGFHRLLPVPPPPPSGPWDDTCFSIPLSADSLEEATRALKGNFPMQDTRR